MNHNHQMQQPAMMDVGTGAVSYPAIEFTTTIVAAYVGKNPIQAEALPGLIGNVFDAVSKLYAANATVKLEPETLSPAVPIRKSVGDDFIICLEDGKKFKSLKRHLSTEYNLTPDQYRAKWGLPADYPMVAPSYSAQRSQLAKDSGLGRKALAN